MAVVGLVTSQKEDCRIQVSMFSLCMNGFSLATLVEPLICITGLAIAKSSDVHS